MRSHPGVDLRRAGPGVDRVEKKVLSRDFRADNVVTFYDVAQRRKVINRAHAELSTSAIRAARLSAAITT